MPDLLKSVAVDMGASSGRVILGKFNGNVLEIEEINRYMNIPVYQNGTLYWNILGMLHEINKGFREVKARGGRDIASVGFDSWGNDFGLIDRKGKLVSNPVHYRDNRTIGMMEKVFEIVGRENVFMQTGIQFMRLNGLYQLFSMVCSQDPVLDIADKLLMIPDLFVYFLTGNTVNEFTSVTTTQMYNPVKGDWARELIRDLNIPERIFTDITKPGTIIGRISVDYSNEFGFENASVVAVAEHDTGSAVVAVPTEEKDFVYISSGTWSLMGVETNNPVINEKTYKYNFTNEGGAFGTFRLLKNVMGLWIVQECKRHWDSAGEVYSYAQLDELAWRSEPFKCFIDPDDDLFVTPGDMPSKIIKFCRDTGQQPPDSKGDVIRCIMESLALKYRNVLEKIKDITGCKGNVIHIVGGGAKDKMLCNFTAKATSTEVVAGPAEATAAGNLLMQLAALGEIKDIVEARRIVRNSFKTEIYHPSDHFEWEQAYNRFKYYIKD